MIDPQNKCIHVHLPKVAGGSIERAITGMGWAYVRENGFKVQHEPAISLKNQYAEFWDSYFKFSFVRNPWDLVISNFIWAHLGLKRAPNKQNLKEFILDIKSKVKPARFLDPKSEWVWSCDQFSFLADSEGAICMDFIGRFENLQEDFNIACDKMGTPRQKLPHTNKTKHKHYTEYYDDETKQIVAEKYAKDIDYFGYQFGE